MMLPKRYCWLALLAAPMLGLANVASAQDRAAAPAEARKIHEYIDFSECFGCHERPSSLASTEWISLRESGVWLREDKHARAFAVLQEERSRQMGRILKEPLGWDDDDASTKQVCLSCHSNWHRGQPKPDERSLEFGVSCQSCHGPGSNYLKPHREVEWRTLTSGEKEARGMIDLREPRRRGEQCLSCHIGNVAQGKVLTHEMYAAGHPPLSGIEVETFCQAMPPHWEPAERKSQRVRELLNVKPDLSAGTKAVVLGSVLPLRASLNLFAAELAAHPERGADFPQFDCYASHHELQTPSWRQQRGYSGAPGRLPPRAWPLALLRAGILEPLGDAELVQLSSQSQSQLAQFYGVLDKRPLGDARLMGDPDESGSLSQKLLTSLDELAARLAARDYTHQESLLILRRLAASLAEQIVDFDSARQIGWAMRTIYGSLPEMPSDDAAIRHVFDEMNNDLTLDLPTAPKWNFREEQAGPSLKASDAPPTGIEEALEANLAAVNGYDPARFQQQMKKLSKLLAGD